MPRKKIKETTFINETIFKRIIKLKGYNIKTLTAENPKNTDYICSERTLRRALKSCDHQIRTCYLEAFAKKINVDPRYLSGEIYDKLYSYAGIECYCRDIQKYPYSRKEYDKIRQQNIKAHLSSILSLFEISYEQFERLGFEEQYNLQHDLFETISNILPRYFKVDAFGNKEMYGLSKIINDLESYKENYYEQQYANTTLREHFLKKPPKGYSVTQIKEMTADQLLDLDRYIQWSTLDDMD